MENSNTNLQTTFIIHVCIFINKSVDFYIDQIINMARKQRKSVTKEMNDIVICMMKSGKYGINEISQNLDIHPHTVRRIIENEEKGIWFVSASEKRKKLVMKEILHMTIPNKEFIMQWPAIIF